jgi:hypothetical protein
LSTLAEPHPNLTAFRQTTAQWWDGLLCGCLIVLAIVCTHPVAEMGFFDDFSYIKTADVYARTGHIVYNGWAAPILGWQIPWGAFFIKIFGFSFTVVRSSTLPIAVAAIWIFFDILVRFGINRRNAYFGALSLGLSPLFLPLATSFMTEINCEFVLLLCFYLCLRAVQATTNLASVAWLVVAAATNAVGGTVRQIAWLGVLIIVPSTAWLLRRRRGVFLAGIVSWCAGLAFIFVCLRWFKSQPYSVTEPLIPHAPLHFGIIRFVRTAIDCVLCLSLLVFPLLALWLRKFSTFTLRVRIFILLFACLFETRMVTQFLRNGTAPWLIDNINNLGLTSGFTFTLGHRSGLLSQPVSLFIIGFSVVAVALTFLIDLFRGSSNTETPAKSRLAILAQPNPRLSWHTEFWLFLPFAAVYSVLIISRSINERCYDRYLLGLLPLALLCLLELYDRSFAKPLPWASYLLLALFAVFSIAGTHDLYAMNRARLQAASILQNAGVPDTRFQLGLDYDGWTQLKYSPTISETAASYLMTADHPFTVPNLAPRCVLWTWTMTSAIDPDYFVVLSPMSCLAPSHFPPVPYHSWIPPFHRAVYIQQRP